MLLLGLQQGATDVEIRAAFKKQALKWHPDKNHSSKESTEKFQAINAAFARLTHADGDDVDDIDEEELYEDDVFDDMEDEYDIDIDTFFDVFESMFGSRLGGRRRGEPTFPYPSREPCDCPDCRACRGQFVFNGGAAADIFYHPANEAQRKAKAREVATEAEKLKHMQDSFMAKQPAVNIESRGENWLQLWVSVGGSTMKQLMPEGVVFEVGVRPQASKGNTAWVTVPQAKGSYTVRANKLKPGCIYHARARLGISGKYSWSGSTDWKAWGPEAQFSTDAPAPKPSKQQQRPKPQPEPEPSEEEEEEEECSKDAATAPANVAAMGTELDADASGSVSGQVDPDGSGSEADEEGNTDGEMEDSSRHVPSESNAQRDQQRIAAMHDAARSCADGNRAKAPPRPHAAVPPSFSSRQSGMAAAEPAAFADATFADLPGFAPGPDVPNPRPGPSSASSYKQAKFAAGPQPHPSKLHTADCKFWLNGGCTRGNGCWFRHDPAQLGASVNRPHQPPAISAYSAQPAMPSASVAPGPTAVRHAANGGRGGVDAARMGFTYGRGSTMGVRRPLTDDIDLVRKREDADLAKAIAESLKLAQPAPSSAAAPVPVPVVQLQVQPTMPPSSGVLPMLGAVAAAPPARAPPVNGVVGGDQQGVPFAVFMAKIQGQQPAPAAAASELQAPMAVPGPRGAAAAAAAVEVMAPTASVASALPGPRPISMPVPGVHSGMPSASAATGPVPGMARPAGLQMPVPYAVPAMAAPLRPGAPSAPVRVAASDALAQAQAMFRRLKEQNQGQ